MRAEKIRAVKLAPNKPAEEVMLVNTLDGLQEAVSEYFCDGLIGFIDLDGDEAIMFHKKGKEYCLTPNRRYSSFGLDDGDFFQGPIYIVAAHFDEDEDNPYLVDLPEDRVKFYVDTYKEPEIILEWEIVLPF